MSVSASLSVFNVKNIFDMRIVPVFWQKCDSFRTAFYPAVHPVIPNIIGCAGRGIRALGINQKLILK